MEPALPTNKTPDAYCDHGPSGPPRSGEQAGLVRAPGSELHDAAWRAADLAYAQLELEIPSLRVSRYFNRQTTRKVENEQAVMEMTGTLARLAAELTPRGYEASLVVRGGLWRPSLVIRNPAVAVHTTEIIAES